MLAILALLTLQIMLASACPYALLTLSGRTNYTNISSAIAAAPLANTTALLVCPLGIIASQEILPPITFPLTIIGTDDAGGLAPYVHVLAPGQKRFTFVVDTGGVLFLSNVRFIFDTNTTLFSIINDGFVSMNDTVLEGDANGGGSVALNITATSLTQLAFAGDSVTFLNLAVGVVLRRGYYSCKNCHYITMLTTAIAMSNTDLSRLQIVYNVFTNCAVEIAYQPLVNGQVSRTTITDNFILNNQIVNCYNYPANFVTPSQSFTPNLALGNGVGGGTTGGGGHSKKHADSPISTAFLVVIFVLLMVVAVVTILMNQSIMSPKKTINTTPA